MVPAVMSHLVLLDGFCQEKWAPIRYAANDAAMRKNKGARCSGDPEGQILVSV